VSDLIKKLRFNYNRLIIKKGEGKLVKAQKVLIIDETIELINDKYKELCVKHDGCRVIQACLKYGSTA
jgi:hypothetical protein